MIFAFMLSECFKNIWTNSLDGGQLLAAEVFISNLGIGNNMQTAPHLRGEVKAGFFYGIGITNNKRKNTMIRTLNSLMREGGIAVFYVYGDSSVLEYNHEAKNLLKKTDAIQIRGGKFLVSDPKKSKEFAQRIKLKSSQSGKESILIKRRENRFPIKLSLFPVKESSLVSSSDDGKLLVVLVEDTSNDRKFMSTSFAEYYQLTDAELALASSLYKGISLQKHSEDRGVKISTTRWTLYNLFSKTHTNSQLELSALVRLFSE